MNETELAALAEDCLRRVCSLPNRTRDVIQFKSLVLEDILDALEEVEEAREP